MSGRPAAFLDRDGTIIVDRHYLGDPAGVELLPAAADGMRRLAAAGFALIVVTNQSGIARGLYTEREFAAVQSRLDELLAAEGLTLDAVYHCPHHPDHGGPCDCRKPGLALFRRAEAELGIELRGSIFVGDRPHDVLPALAFGARGFLVRTGYGRAAGSLPAGVSTADDLADVARRVVGGGAKPADSAD